MINRKSIEAVDQANFSKEFCRPLYSSYCFSQIPGTIESVFSKNFSRGLPEDVWDKQDYDHLILLFLDGFGWTFYEKYQTKLPLLQFFEQEGVVSKITSMFPSTTAAHVTCINTGLTPSESGLYEWFIYEPSLNEIIAPLPYHFAGERKTDSLPLDSRHLIPQKTLYHRLNALGVNTYAIQAASITGSTFSDGILSGAHQIPYRQPKEAFEKLIETLEGKTYHFFYYADIDAIGHRKGTTSQEFSKAIEKISKEIESLIKKLPKKTALIVTADHGMVDVSPENTFYLNQKIPNIEKYFQVGNRKKPLAPAGSCRDFFCHVIPEKLEEFEEILKHFLKEKGEVYLTKDFIDGGFFGLNSPSKQFLNRVGNLLILPYKGEAIWWFEKNHFQQNFFAAHGGLTREEMEIPFLFYAT